MALIRYNFIQCNIVYTTNMPQNDIYIKIKHVSRVVLIRSLRVRVRALTREMWYNYLFGAVTRISFYWFYTLRWNAIRLHTVSWYQTGATNTLLYEDNWATAWQNEQNDVRTAKIQISLGIRPVWSEYSLSTWRKRGSLATHWAHNEDSDQTRRMPRLIWVFTERTCSFVRFVMLRLKSYYWTLPSVTDLQVFPQPL